MEEDQEISKRERKKLNKEKKESSETKSSIQNKLIVVGGIIALAVGAFWFMYKGGSNGTEPTETPQIVAPTEVTAEDHSKGPEEALVTLVEYGDFQCPACASYQPIVDQLAEEFENDLQIVYRHFPLRSIHKHAQASAAAAEAAAEQGKFWEMYDILYQRQDDWAALRDPRSTYVGYADELGLDTKQFEDYMNSSEAKAKVDADYDGGFAAGINSTPTFYLEGSKVQNPQGLEPFRELIQQVIDSKKSEDENVENEVVPTL